MTTMQRAISSYFKIILASIEAILPENDETKLQIPNKLLSS
jgi:hypothetical protein